MIGLKMVGCCVHVATLINYLAKYKYNPFKLPGKYLDSVLARMDRPSNNPEIIRNTRRRREQSSSSEEDSVDSSEDFDNSSNSSESDFTSSSGESNDEDTECINDIYMSFKDWYSSNYNDKPEPKKVLVNYFKQKHVIC